MVENQLHQGLTPTASIAAIAEAFENNPLVQGLRFVGADDEHLRNAGEVLMHQALDLLDIKRPEPRPSITQRIGRLLRMSS